MENNATAQAIFQAFNGLPRSDAAGRLAVLASAHSQNGTSFIARSIALAAAAHYAPQGKRVLLLDYDLYKQSQLQAVMDMGAVHGPYDASFSATPFWQVRAGILDESPILAPYPYGSIYLQDHTGLAVSVFRWDQIGANQSVKIVNSPDYWNALRSQFAMTIIDGPARDRTNMVEMLYPYMDSTALVSSPQNAQSPQTLQMAQDITQAGGHFSGLVLNNFHSELV